MLLIHVHHDVILTYHLLHTYIPLLWNLSFPRFFFQLVYHLVYIFPAFRNLSSGKCCPFHNSEIFSGPPAQIKYYVESNFLKQSTRIYVFKATLPYNLSRSFLSNECEWTVFLRLWRNSCIVTALQNIIRLF